MDPVIEEALKGLGYVEELSTAVMSDKALRPTQGVEVKEGMINVLTGLQGYITGLMAQVESWDDSRPMDTCPLIGLVLGVSTRTKDLTPEDEERLGKRVLREEEFLGQDTLMVLGDPTVPMLRLTASIEDLVARHRPHLDLDS